MVTIQELDNLLANELRDYQSGLDTNHDGSRILGFVVSSDFNDLDHTKRQKKLWEILEKHLSKQDLASLGPIITMTPAGADVGENAA